MGIVFVSYSRQDAKKVKSIASRLESDGIKVWIDCKDIKPGHLWTVEIVKAIDTADSFLLMLSPNCHGLTSMEQVKVKITESDIPSIEKRLFADRVGDVNLSLPAQEG